MISFYSVTQLSTELFTGEGAAKKTFNYLYKESFNHVNKHFLELA